MLPTPCPTRSDFFALRTCRPAVSRRVSALSPAPPPTTESFTPSGIHAHYRCYCCCSPLSLVRPLACLPSGSPVAPPVSAGLCFSPTAIWDLKCLPAFLRSLEHLLHPYHRQNFFAVLSLVPPIALPSTQTPGVLARSLPGFCHTTLFYTLDPLLLID